MTRIKICGITTLESALEADRHGVDALGFIFAKSKRRIDKITARNIINNLSPLVTTVGVFVNEDQEIVKDIAQFCQLDVLQLHGDESPQYFEQVAKITGKKVIKAIRVKDASSLVNLDSYPSNSFVLDTYNKESYGGTGESFNWDLINKISHHRIILAGGLDVNNISIAIKTVNPYGIDVSSSLETAGKKDLLKIREFIQVVRRCKDNETV